MHYHCQVTSLQVVMPPPHQRAPEMRSPNRIGEVKVAEAEVLSVVAPADPTVAVALALPTARPSPSPPSHGDQNETSESSGDETDAVEAGINSD